MWKSLNRQNLLLLSIVLASTVLGSTLIFLKRISDSSTDKKIFTVKPVVASSESLLNTPHITIAADLIDRQQGTAALARLQNLEAEYPLLTPHIFLARGKAHLLEQNQQDAEAVWKQLIAEHPTSSATAEALYLLGKNNNVYWQQAIARFPFHPRTQENIRQQLDRNPNQPRLMAILVKYTPDAAGVDEMRDRLVAQYASQLTPQEWEAIADSYWLKWDYGKAGQAYAKAPVTSRNLYRAGRGYHLGNDNDTAKKYYLQLIREYPTASDTGWGLRRLATLVDRRQALNYLDLAIARFPSQAPEALVEKAQLLEALNSPKSAERAIQTLLTEYTHSEAAARYRWDVASKQAERGDLVAAWHWAQAVVTDNPDSSLAPKAGFWIAKWAEKLNRPEDATTAYKSVLSRFPRSYYAWRSAVALGWDVGDFTTVRHKTPEVVKGIKIIPPGGSETFQQLYQVGLEKEAWAQFQTEIGDRSKLTVAEDFTQGLLKLDRGENLRGINQIWFLEDRDTPRDKQQWQQLRQTPAYWQALYPFPYEDTILKWSQQRQLNPLLVTSLIRQESRFEPAIESSAGALGLMQVMPATGQAAAETIGLSNYSLTEPEDNINIGTYYLDFTHQKYNNNSMLAVASYNAGPNAVAKWVNRYGLQDADEFVEKIPYRETKGYVESVFENYWNYMLIYNPEISKLLQDMNTESSI